MNAMVIIGFFTIKQENIPTYNDLTWQTKSSNHNQLQLHLSHLLTPEVMTLFLPHKHLGILLYQIKTLSMPAMNQDLLTLLKKLLNHLLIANKFWLININHQEINVQQLHRVYNVELLEQSVTDLSTTKIN